MTARPQVDQQNLHFAAIIKSIVPGEFSTVMPWSGETQRGRT